jgi:uncharacterized iron-regulated membrane protein
MVQTTTIILGSIMIFMVLSGLIVLRRLGRDDRDAWALYPQGLARTASLTRYKAANRRVRVRVLARAPVS